MTAFTLGEATALALDRMRVGDAGLNNVRVRAPAKSGAPHRTGAPVRRDSIEAGTFEEHFFAVPAKGETDRLLRMARAALDAGRRLKRDMRAGGRLEGRVLSPAETALAGLTAGAVRVFEEICTLARLNQGRVFPSYDRLAAATALGRATVARSLRALELAGFLLRQRRFKRVEGEGEGPRYAQTSNVYRPLLPARLLAHLPRWLSPPPLPDDVVQQAATRTADVAAMHAGLSCRELAETVVGGSLGRVLAKLGARIDARSALQQAECESQNQPQPLLDSIYSGKSGVGLAGRHVTPDGEPGPTATTPWANHA
jgi:hypothetical protein